MTRTAHDGPHGDGDRAGRGGGAYGDGGGGSTARGGTYGDGDDSTARRGAHGDRDSTTQHGRYGNGARTLADEAEGYLLAHLHHDQARREAEELCAAMPWLTATQVEELTRHYVRRRIDLTRRMLLDTARRADELRQEYEDRYATLRHDLLKRHAACACAVLACAGGVSTLAGLLAR
ncbi:hypothetical protein GCM10027074_34480 [Streptomyces deserti]